MAQIIIHLTHDSSVKDALKLCDKLRMNKIAVAVDFIMGVTDPPCCPVCGTELTAGICIPCSDPPDRIGV